MAIIKKITDLPTSELQEIRTIDEIVLFAKPFSLTRTTVKSLFEYLKKKALEDGELTVILTDENQIILKPKSND